MQATFCPLHIELAPGAPLPSLILCKLHHHQIIPPTVVFVQLLIFFAFDARMPGDPALRAKQSSALRALRLSHNLSSIICQKRSAVCERAVKLLQPRDHGLTKSLPPSLKHFRWDDGLAEFGFQQPLTLGLWTTHHHHVLLDPGSDVFAHAVGAEHMRAAVVSEHLLCCLAIHANPTEARRGLTHVRGDRRLGFSRSSLAAVC